VRTVKKLIFLCRNYGGYTSPDNIFEGDDHNVYGRGNRAIADGMSFSSSANKYGLDREAEREPAGLLQRNSSGIKDRPLKEGIHEKIKFH